MSGPVLLVGGPFDGVSMTAPDPAGPVSVNVPSRELVQALREGVPLDGAPDLDVAVYQPKILDFFGTLLRVHVMEGTPAERWEASLATCLLSDLGKELII